MQYFQAQASMPQANTTAPVVQAGKDGKDDKKTNGQGDFQKAMNTQMKYMFPLMIGYFSYTLPVGLALYWNVFSIMGIMQYKKVNGKLKVK